MGFRFPKDNLGCNESFCVQKQPFADAIQNSILRNFAKFTGKHLPWSLFFNKVAGLRFQHRCFPVSFAKFLRTTFFTEHLWWRLLCIRQKTSNFKIIVFFFQVKPSSMILNEVNFKTTIILRLI